MLKNILLTASLVSLAAAAAPAAMIDFSSPGASAVINGALFKTGDALPSGASLDPFLRFDGHKTEEGYNTSGTPAPLDDVAGAWTHGLAVNSLPTTTISGVQYAAFALEINEHNGANTSLSLDALQIYTSPIAGKTASNPTTLGALRYNLDASSDNWLKLDSSVNTGGQNLLVYIPMSAFSGAAPADAVYLYSTFGSNNTSSGGYEQWSTVAAASPALTPAPGTATLFVMGSLVVLSRRRWSAAHL